MLKLRVVATTVALIAVAALTYTYLPTRTEEEKRNPIDLHVVWSPSPVPRSSLDPVFIDITVFRAKGEPENYGFQRWQSPFDHTVYANAGDKILFSAGRDDGVLDILTCLINYHGKQARFSDKVVDGTVTCDWIVA